MKQVFTVGGKDYEIERTAENLLNALDYQQKSAEIHESVVIDPTDDKFKESAIYDSQKKLTLLVKEFVKPFLKLSDQEYLKTDPVELNEFALSVYDFLVGGSSETKAGEQLASVMQSIKSTK